jgi:hypothetical protein
MLIRDCHGCDCMVVGFTTTGLISIYNHKRCEFLNLPWGGVLNTILSYVIMFVSELRQVSDFLRVISVLPPIKLSSTI